LSLCEVMVGGNFATPLAVRVTEIGLAVRGLNCALPLFLGIVLYCIVRTPVSALQFSCFGVPAQLDVFICSGSEANK